MPAARHGYRCSRGEDQHHDPFLQQSPRTTLQQVLLARGSDEWQVDIAAQTLRLLPALERLQIRFSFDDEEPPQDLLGTLLPRRLSVSLDAATVAAAAEAGMALPLGMPAVPPILRNLLHLALIFPPRSVIPPTAHLPETLSTLTQVRVWIASGWAAGCGVANARRAVGPA